MKGETREQRLARLVKELSELRPFDQYGWLIEPYVPEYEVVKEQQPEQQHTAQQIVVEKSA